MTTIAASATKQTRRAGVGKIALASLVGTTIEFYDFYIFGTAAALVFGPDVLSRNRRPKTQTLNAYLTFGIAFLARPVGSFLFGHFGDRNRAKSTLVATMMTMGLATTLIGALPYYASAGVFAPWLLAALRFCKGVGLGGEWGGAALIAVENAPEGQARLVRHVPATRSADRLPHRDRTFLLLLVGSARGLLSTGRGACLPVQRRTRRDRTLCARLARGDAGVQGALSEDKRVDVPLAAILRDHLSPADPGVARRSSSVTRSSTSRPSMRWAMACGRSASRGRTFSGCCAGRSCSWRSRRRSPRRSPIVSAGGRCCSLPPSSRSLSASPCRRCCRRDGGVFAFLALALGAMGLTFAPLGALLPELFPVPVRYTGAASAYNLGGILGASFAPSLAQVLEARGGVAWVGYYIAVAGAISFLAVFSMRETQDGKAASAG